MKVKDLRMLLSEEYDELDVAIGWDGHVDFCFEPVHVAEARDVHMLLPGPSTTDLTKTFVLMGPDFSKHR